MGKRNDDGDKIIEALRSSYEIRTGSKNNHITLPGNAQFFMEKNKIRIYLGVKSVCENMQENEAAFESWALAFKNWLGDINEVSLEWDRPTNINNGHYQRFLYRVCKFRELFSWFLIGASSQELLKELKLIAYKDAKYIINFPSNAQSEETNGTEAYYEHLFVDKYKYLLTSVADVYEDKIFRQLPVGLFKDRVNKDTAIFTGGKSAIDIWGISKDSKRLSIFELKAPDVNKIGIISELFFYAVFEEDMLNKRFIYDESIICNRGINEILELQNFEHKNIDAFILATNIHPLIDMKMIELLNQSFAQKQRNIKFGYICYSTTLLDSEKKY